MSVKVEAIRFGEVEKRLAKAAATNAIVQHHLHAMRNGATILDTLTSCISMLAEHNNALHKMMARKAALETPHIVMEQVEGLRSPIVRTKEYIDNKGVKWQVWVPEHDADEPTIIEKSLPVV